MKKIISLFQRNYDGDHFVRDEVVPGAEWVLKIHPEPHPQMNAHRYQGCWIVRGQHAMNYACQQKRKLVIVSKVDRKRAAFEMLEDFFCWGNLRRSLHTAYTNGWFQ